MGCLTHDLFIEFELSGVRIRPFSVNINQSISDQFDDTRCQITSEAATCIGDNAQYMEPVRIMYGNHCLYYGFFDHDSIHKGDTTSWFYIADPRRVLERGSITNEWTEVDADTVATEAFSERIDPHGVLTGITVGPEADGTMVQHDDLGWVTRGMRYFTDFDEMDQTSDINYTQILENATRSLNPFRSSQGRFDFREDTPYEAILQICEAWEIYPKVYPNGELALKHAFNDPLAYHAGIDGGMFRITEFSVPETRNPVNGVIVKGGIKDGWGERIADLAAGESQKETRAGAYFRNTTDGTILEYDKRDLTDASALKGAARRKLLNTLVTNHTGNVTIDVNSSQVPDEWLEMIAPGDLLAISMDHHNCIDVQDGLYRIESVRQKIDGHQGWMINIRLSLAVTNLIEETIDEEYWEFDAEDEDHIVDSAVDWLTTSTASGITSIGSGLL